ncbi:MAG TPA: DUF1499 domain-containing protein [Stellaceae bacterium]
MADMTVGGAVANRLAFYMPRLGFGLAVLSVILLALAPIGWRTGMWHFRTSFWYLMQPAAYLGIAAGVVSLIALIWWGSMGTAGRAMALAGLAIGAFMFYIPWSYYHTLGTVPRIHDITTDTANPPGFSPAVLQARAAEKGNSVDYDQKTAALQKEGYPDLAPVTVRLPPAEAFKRALAAAQAMPGWTIVTTDLAGGRIEAYQRTRFMGFTDDVVIRVAPDGAGSRIDIRSVSRQGISDFGVNAKRIRDYEEALRQQLG